MSARSSQKKILDLLANCIVEILITEGDAMHKANTISVVGIKALAAKKQRPGVGGSDLGEDKG